MAPLYNPPGGVAPSGSAGGDLSGTYPNPTVAKTNGVAMPASAGSSGNVLTSNGTAWISSAPSGGSSSFTPAVLTSSFSLTSGSYTTPTGMSWTISSTGWYAFELGARVTTGGAAGQGFNVNFNHTGSYSNPALRLWYGTGDPASMTYRYAESEYITHVSTLSTSTTYLFHVHGIMNLTATGTLTIKCLAQATGSSMLSGSYGLIRKL